MRSWAAKQNTMKKILIIFAMTLVTGAAFGQGKTIAKGKGWSLKIDQDKNFTINHVVESDEFRKSTPVIKVKTAEEIKQIIKASHKAFETGVPVYLSNGIVVRKTFQWVEVRACDDEEANFKRLTPPRLKKMKRSIELWDAK